MKKIQYITLFFLIGVFATLVSCEKDEIMSFEGKPAINFKGESTEYSFLVNQENEYIQEVEVRIIGDTTDYDRNFSVEVVKDTNTTATSEQYEILDGVVKAGEFTGKLSVKLFNSDALADTMVRIKLKLIDSDDFVAGNIESSYYEIGWTDKIIVPSWGLYKYFFCATKSTSCYRAIVASTGLVKFGMTEYRAMSYATGATVLGTIFGDYVKQWNLDHPNEPLRHDDGDKKGELIEPKYYTKSKYD